MQRPSDLFDRDTEWFDLSSFASQPGSGTRLALVRGRRRQGKSFLLRRLADAAGGFYYQALQQDRTQALAAFGAALGGFVGVPGGRLSFDDWESAVGAVADVRRDDRPLLVVLDEFPYLLTHSPELPSLLQRHIDASRDGGPPMRLIVCGSALSVMANLLEGSQALRGRATHDIPVRPFDYRKAAQFWGIRDPKVAFLVHAVLGGTPGYRDLLTVKPPTRVADFDKWIGQGVLNPASALFREDDYLLTEERPMTDRALYHAIVGAIAAGNRSQGAIAAALGRESQAVQHSLRALVDAGFVAAEDDMLRQRRPFYRLVDPVVRFHHVVTRPDLARFEERRVDEAWADARPRFSTHVLGPHFEQLAREFTFLFASPDTVGAAVAAVGAAVVNDARGRAQHELDVVATTRTRRGATEVVAIGEAKHTASARTLRDVERLEHVRALLVDRAVALPTTKLLLFSQAGFDRNVMSLAKRRGDVELIDLTRIYEGD